MTRLVPTKGSDFRLERQMAVVVPSTRFEKPVSKAEFRRRVKQTRDKLHRTFGGTTRTVGVGTFTSERLKPGLTVEEDVVVVESYADQPVWTKKKNEMIKWLRSKAREWGQESVAFEFEGDLFIVNP